MTDRSIKDADNAARLNEWFRLDRHLAELHRELEEEREVIGIIARERDALREECADLHATNEALRARLTRALDGERRAQARLGKRDVRGWLAVVRDWLEGDD